MPQIHRIALVPYSAEKMYELVNDVQSYPEFIPGCSGSRVLESGLSQMTVSVDITNVGIRKTFTTYNTLINNQSILMFLVDGPFKKLQGGWKFTPLNPDVCRIEFHLDFEFTNKIMGVTFEYVFRDLASNIIQAFIIRASKICNSA